VSQDASLLAGEIQDLATTVDRVAEAIRTRPEPRVEVNVPEGLAPTVNVTVPELRAPDIVVNVPEQRPPDVNVAAANVTFNPKISVQPAQPALPVAYEVDITDRDDNGYILRFTITPING